MSTDATLAIVASIALILGAVSLIMQLLSRDERRTVRERVSEHRRWLRDNGDLPTRHSSLKTEVDLIKEHLQIDVVYNPERYRTVPEQIVVTTAAPKPKTRRRS